MAEQSLNQQANVETLCKMATSFRQIKEHYTDDEMKEIQDGINFLIGKLQKVCGKQDITAKVQIKMPMPVKMSEILNKLKQREAKHVNNKRITGGVSYST